MFPVATFPTATICRTLHLSMVDHLVPAQCLTAAHREPLPGEDRGTPTTESHACPRRTQGILGAALRIARLQSADVSPDRGAPRSCELLMPEGDADRMPWRLGRPRHREIGVARLLAAHHRTRESVRSSPSTSCMLLNVVDHSAIKTESDFSKRSTLRVLLSSAEPDSANTTSEQG